MRTAGSSAPHGSSDELPHDEGVRLAPPFIRVALEDVGAARRDDGVVAPGLNVAAWTVRDAETYRRIEGLGALAICAEADALDG